MEANFRVLDKKVLAGMNEGQRCSTHELMMEIRSRWRNEHTLHTGDNPELGMHYSQGSLDDKRHRESGRERKVLKTWESFGTSLSY